MTRQRGGRETSTTPPVVDPLHSPAWTTFQQTVQQVVLRYPGSPADLALRLRMQRATLLNKANPAQPHELKVSELAMLAHVTHNLAPVFEFNRALGLATVHLGEFSGVADLELLSLYTQWHAELGTTAHRLHDALSDGVITPLEVERIEHAGYAAIRAFFELLSRARALAQAEESL